MYKCYCIAVPTSSVCLVCVRVRRLLRLFYKKCVVHVVGRRVGVRERKVEDGHSYPPRAASRCVCYAAIFSLLPTLRHCRKSTYMNLLLCDMAYYCFWEIYSYACVLPDTVLALETKMKIRSFDAHMISNKNKV